MTDSESDNKVSKSSGTNSRLDNRLGRRRLAASRCTGRIILNLASPWTPPKCRRLSISPRRHANPARATAFSAYRQVLRLGVAQIGAALMTTWLRVREQIHSNLLGQRLMVGEARVIVILNSLTSRFLSCDHSLAGQRVLAALNTSVQQQSSVLSYIDGFWLTFGAAMSGCSRSPS